MAAGITFKKSPPRGEIIGAVPYPHLSDSRLWFVMVKDGEEYILWSHNTQDGSYFWGHYQLDREKAYRLYVQGLTERAESAGYRMTEEKS